MSIQEISAEGLASLFFHYQAALASDFDCAPQGPAEWDKISLNERRRMIAAARLTPLDLSSQSERASSASETPAIGDHRGETGREWGC